MHTDLLHPQETSSHWLIALLRPQERSLLMTHWLITSIRDIITLTYYIHKRHHCCVLMTHKRHHCWWHTDLLHPQERSLVMTHWLITSTRDIITLTYCLIASTREIIVDDTLTYYIHKRHHHIDFFVHKRHHCWWHTDLLRPQERSLVMTHWLITSTRDIIVVCWWHTRDIIVDDTLTYCIHKRHHCWWHTDLLRPQETSSHWLSTSTRDIIVVCWWHIDLLRPQERSLVMTHWLITSTRDIIVDDTLTYCIHKRDHCWWHIVLLRPQETSSHWLSTSTRDIIVVCPTRARS